MHQSVIFTTMIPELFKEFGLIGRVRQCGKRCFCRVRQCGKNIYFFLCPLIAALRNLNISGRISTVSPPCKYQQLRRRRKRRRATKPPVTPRRFPAKLFLTRWFGFCAFFFFFWLMLEEHQRACPVPL